VLVCASCGHENSEGAKFCEECGFSFAAVPVRANEQRKTVTVLFCDLAGSTALSETLDPERLRALLARYFESMKAIVERHGGSVEKFIGDAVMAAFGVPVLHEDDALRAVRSAVEMRDSLPELGLRGRIGVMTGEVVTGTQERLATGDAVNVAARLEQAARPGEVLVGQPTLALVRDAVEVEPVEPLELKGKAEPVPAYRLLRVREAPERLHEARFVGRERELAILREAWDRVQAEQRCELVTLVGRCRRTWWVPPIAIPSSLRTHRRQYPKRRSPIPVWGDRRRRRLGGALEMRVHGLTQSRSKSAARLRTSSSSRMGMYRSR